VRDWVAVVRRGLLLAALLAGLGALLLVDVTICPFANLTGQPCPGCGLTRATLALLLGRFDQAVQLHPLSPVVLVVLAVAAFDGSRRLLSGTDNKPSTRRGERLFAWVFGVLSVALLALWIARFLGHFGGPVEVLGVLSRIGAIS
jgi:hypothetical protein